MVSHNLDEIKNSCNKLLWVKNGEILFYNDVNKGLNAYQNWNESN